MSYRDIGCDNCHMQNQCSAEAKARGWCEGWAPDHLGEVSRLREALSAALSRAETAERALASARQEVERLRGALTEASGALWRAANMLDAINGADPSADRQKAARDAGAAAIASSAALRAAPSPGPAPQEADEDPVLVPCVMCGTLVHPDNTERHCAPAPSGETEPRCPNCGYTWRDVHEQMDHRFCSGPGPAGPDTYVAAAAPSPGPEPSGETVARCARCGRGRDLDAQYHCGGCYREMEARAAAHDPRHAEKEARLREWRAPASERQEAERLRGALTEASGALWRAANMLDAINGADPSADRQKAARDAGAAAVASSAALRAAPSPGPEPSGETGPEPVLRECMTCGDGRANGMDCAGVRATRRGEGIIVPCPQWIPDPAPASPPGSATETNTKDEET